MQTQRRLAQPFGLALALVACKPYTELPADTVITCGTSDDCPAALNSCHNGVCVDPDNIDTTPPDLVAPVTVSPRRVAAGIRCGVSLEVSEALLGPPVVTLALASARPLDCTGSGPGYVCTFTPSGTENAGAGGEISVDLELTDRARNVTRRSAVASVTLDFAPPRLSIANLAYFPGPDNPLPAVERATAGTRVRVVVSADEAIAATPRPSLTGRLGSTGGAPLAFGVDEASLVDADDAQVAFEVEVPAAQEDGEYTLQVGWSDDLGNAGTAELASPHVNIKTTPPVLDVDQQALVFVRSPIGNAAPESLGGYTIPAGPYFAVEPADPLLDGALLPEGALTLEGGALPSQVTVQDSNAGNPLVLGTLRPSGGAFPRQKLSSPDLPTVYLVGVDDAGNRSAAVPLAQAEWVATPDVPQFGRPPHVLTAVPAAGAARDQDGAITPPSSAAGGLEGDGILARSTLHWSSLAPTARPADRRYAAAHDTARGRLVLFGGSSRRETWEWDGATWIQVASFGPPERDRCAMAYDAARGRVVLFGGYASGALGDTWEWDGAGWTQRASGGPPPRVAPAMAYDSARGRVVLFGGSPSGGFPFGDTWEWDGTAWSQVASGGPEARYEHALAYDAARGQTILFGGLTYVSGQVYFGDTWAWDGAAWTRLATSGPSPRAFLGLAYDASRGRVVLSGGADGSTQALGDTWEWDGASWAPVAGGTLARSSQAMAYDAARAEVVSFGGLGLDALGNLAHQRDTWTWNGARWTRRLDTPPAARSAHAMAYDRARDRTVLFGGAGEGSPWLADTWEWDGSDWRQIATTGPRGRYGHGMAHDDQRGSSVVFGGYAGYASGVLPGPADDTWSWDGSAWAQGASGGPLPRESTAMAHDADRGRTVLFGGSTGSQSLDDTWEWDGSQWSPRWVAGPSSRYGHAMTYDRARHRVVLFGGYDASGDLHDTWEWDGAGWSKVADSGPPARAEHVLAYDEARRRVVLFGGYGFGGALQDAWEWDGSSWRDVTSPGPSPRRGAAMIYDPVRARMVLFGGGGAAASLQDTWTLDVGPDRRPAITFLASSGPLGIDPSRVRRLGVRAFAGGTFAGAHGPEGGVVLLGWSTRGASNEPGRWEALASTATAAATSPPYLPAPPASRVAWESTSADEARRFLVGRDGFAFQVRPDGGSGTEHDGAAVALDYIEVRVRYAVP